ncbi:MAG: glycosyltransferase family 4 protein, partial [Candidatus Aenigmatarchaeota archaeon]
MRKLKIWVVGTRGIPGLQGGVEKRIESIYPRIINDNLQIVVVNRSNYFKNKISEWHGIKLVYLWAPKNKYLEAPIHTFFAILLAKIKSANIIHIQAIGPAFFTPLVKFLGLKVIVTHHGPDYLRKKWEKFAKLILKLGEFFAVKFADKIIVVSNTIKKFIEEKYGRKDLVVIPNGINIQEFVPPGETLKKYNLEPKKYILCVARFVPEKGLHDLINAYKKIGNPDFKLVIVGDADIETDYSRKIKTTAKNINGIVLTGILTGKDLNEIYSNAGL